MFDTQIIKNRFIGLMKIIFFFLFIKGIYPLLLLPLIMLYFIFYALTIDFNDVSWYNLIFWILFFIITVVVIQYLKTIVFFCVAKKTDVVKIFDRMPFIASFIFILAIDFLVLMGIDYYDLDSHEWTSYIFNFYFFLTVSAFCGCWSVFLMYKAAKLLIGKFPSRFVWLKKIYPNFLKNVQRSTALFIETIIYFFILLLLEYVFPVGEHLHFNVVCFRIFFVILLIITAIELVKIIKNKYIKNI